MAHPKQSTEESEWSNNGQLAILVPCQIIHTPPKQRKEGEEGSPVSDVVVATPVQRALLALHEEWCREGGTHFLVELALRTSVAASLRGDAAAVWGHHAWRLGTVSQSSELNWEGWGQGGGGVREGEREMGMSGGM